eukprot:m.686502 g.686502  ORF g.686502 m.686502 type:complete len:54 (-) comp58626_c0_seq59:4801-4962(-)
MKESTLTLQHVKASHSFGGLIHLPDDWGSNDAANASQFASQDNDTHPTALLRK